MVPAGAIRRCPVCKGTNDSERYKISLRAEDIHPIDRNNEIIGDFMFFGKQGQVLTGHDASLLVSQVRGRHNYTPPTIADIVGKIYDITAEVNQDTYDNNPGHLILKVSKAEASTIPSPAQQGSPQPKSPTSTSNEQTATPVKDILSSPSIHAQKEATSGTEPKKRKESSETPRASAKRTNNTTKESAKVLFPTA